ncbi:MAG: hypothetical protein ACRC2T_07845 [Thermoguttaceae bacterium]
MEIPDGYTKSQVQNKFTLEFKVTNILGATDTVTAYVHFGWAEVQTCFAGKIIPSQIKVNGNKSDQTQSNSVTVGQEVHSKVVYDNSFSPIANSYNGKYYSWSTPTGGMYVKDYISNVIEGRAVYHTVADYGERVMQLPYFRRGRDVLINFNKRIWLHLLNSSVKKKEFGGNHANFQLIYNPHLLK